MGRCINPGNDLFQNSLNSEIYIDKSNLIAFTNKCLETEQRYLCVSRPRRFGKSMAINMLAAYYDKSVDSSTMFQDLNISKHPSYRKNLNQYSVIRINMQEYISKTNSVAELISLITKVFIADIKKSGLEISFLMDNDLSFCLSDYYEQTGNKLIILIDEWDCIFREYSQKTEEQRNYLDFLRDLLKDKSYVALAYMTGILPIKKYGTHSALNMFEEYSMINPGELAEFVGFTSDEVLNLCEKYQMNFEEAKDWYNGYSFGRDIQIYSPKSVVSAMLAHQFSDYWNQTETYEALKVYIDMNIGKLKDQIREMLADGRPTINIRTSNNDMTTFNSSDDVFTLMVHLGYLAYDYDSKTVSIPNREIHMEFLNAMQGKEWTETIRMIQESRNLLENIWTMNGKAVAEHIEQAHMQTSILQYNDENALSYTLSLALYTARDYYMVVREMPAGKGFADLVYLPKVPTQHPALIVELKWDKSANTAINQIKDKVYPECLVGFIGEILLVGINYDKSTKKHECIIEAIQK